jgi:hypothetical protein
MGTATTDTIRAMMAKRHISCPVTDAHLRTEFEAFAKDLARFLNELKDNGEVRRAPELWLDSLFSGGTRAAVRALVAELLLRVMFIELPIWFQSVQPENANNPAPNVEEVQRAVESVLRADVGEGASGE